MTGPGRGDDAVADRTALQVDAFDPYHRTGWSVMIHGVAEDATEPQVGRVTVEPWAPGPKVWWVQIRPTQITGRRLRLVDSW